jgi:SAM-dependent methyltransferase
MTHDSPSAVSPWIRRFADHVPAGGRVLDLACGAGRHTRLFLDRGCRVLAVDRDLSGLCDLRGVANLETWETDLERGGDRPLAGRQFDAVVVVNYLHRPLLADLVCAVAPGGLLLYETFAAGHERFGRPRNPDYLLARHELLEAVRGRLRVLAYEDLEVGEPRPAAVQRIAARREAAAGPGAKPD